ncbi:MAG: DUF3106 domain-containing protein [Terriglobales bacterium]|nr:DUF3106 domain-containing protein [Terriglobales bacterium]
MLGFNFMAVRALAASLAIAACTTASFASGQHEQSRRDVPRPPAVRQSSPAPARAPQTRMENRQPPMQGHHSGQWLRQYGDVPPDQQRRVLQNDPQFRRLPPQRQQQLQQRLQDFSRRPPEQQQRILNRMETWEHLTPQQKQTARQMHSQFQQLPPERQQVLKNAIQALRAMPPDARQRAIQSGRFSQYSPQERELLNGALQLPLAPAQPSQNYVPRPPH